MIALVSCLWLSGSLRIHKLCCSLCLVLRLIPGFFERRKLITDSIRQKKRRRTLQIYGLSVVCLIRLSKPRVHGHARLDTFVPGKHCTWSGVLEIHTFVGVGETRESHALLKCKTKLYFRMCDSHSELIHRICYLRRRSNLHNRFASCLSYALKTIIKTQASSYSDIAKIVVEIDICSRVSESHIVRVNLCAHRAFIGAQLPKVHNQIVS